MENKESFVQLYTRLYNENFEELEKKRQKDKKQTLGIVLALFVVILLFGTMPIIGIPAFIILVIFLIARAFKNVSHSSIVSKTYMVNGKVVSNTIEDTGPDTMSYKGMFKEKIILPIIQNALPGSNYYPTSGISAAEYRLGDWERYDTYSSEDKMVTEISAGENSEFKSILEISEVHTQDRREDSDGDTHYVTLFHGLAGQVKIPKNIGCYIKVINNQFSLFGKSKNKLEMDMSEFEKMFDVETDDRIKAMQILTADVMTDLINLVNTGRVKFEFKISRDNMYIRFHTGELFEPELFGKSMQLERLRRYFDIVKSVKNIVEHICSIIQNVEI